MTRAERTLVDLRAQVKAALTGMECAVPFTVRERWSRGSAEGAVLTYAEKENRSTDCPVVDQLSYQIDIWAAERGQTEALAQAANEALLDMGLRRLSKEERAEELGLRRCTMVFGRRVDKRFGRLID